MKTAKKKATKAAEETELLFSDEESGSDGEEDIVVFDAAQSTAKTSLDAIESPISLEERHSRSANKKLKRKQKKTGLRPMRFEDNFDESKGCEHYHKTWLLVLALLSFVFLFMAITLFALAF